MGLSSPAMREGCNATEETANETIASAEALAACKYEQFLQSRNQTLDSTSATASGTLTINNGANIMALYVSIAAAELARAQGDKDMEYALLKRAFDYQKELQYDEPAPFFYPVGETLAGPSRVCTRRPSCTLCWTVRVRRLQPRSPW